MSLTVPRRALIAGALAATPVLAGEADPLAGPALFRDIETYSAFGEHRTGGGPDHATSRWLASELKRAGFAAELAPWRTPQFMLRDCRFVWGSQPPAIPLWWPKTTGPEGVSGPLYPFEARYPVAGGIVFARAEGLIGGGAVLNPGNPVAAMVRDAAARGATAFVLVQANPFGQPVALNAQNGHEGFPIPTIAVGVDRPGAFGDLHLASALRLVIDGDMAPDAIGYEVVGRLGAGSKEVIVSTPSSGWFHCAGERGPGVAIWLALARAIGRRPPPGVRFTFVASSGHELDGVGMHHFLQEIAPKPERVTSWLHLGAGIATFGYDGARRLDTVSTTRGLMTNDPALMPALERDFAGQPGLKPLLTDKPVGEMTYMAEHGYRCWGIAGAWALHHMPTDLPERATSPQILEPTARAIHRALLAAVTA